MFKMVYRATHVLLVLFGGEIASNAYIIEDIDSTILLSQQLWLLSAIYREGAL